MPAIGHLDGRGVRKLGFPDPKKGFIENHIFEPQPIKVGVLPNSSVSRCT